MNEAVVDVSGLTRRFGRTLALDDVSFRIEPGQVYGLVGGNGHGKTTLIRHLLGLLRARKGTVRVFGTDPVKYPEQVLLRIGYLSEERELPGWMRIGELLRYTAAFYPRWDVKYAEELVETFGLDRSDRVKNLSKGMRAQTGLILAVAHRPELLLLDEPSTGLDAVVRQDILREIIRAVADDGRTALFSSHLLDEVEQMSDSIFLIDEGRLVLQGLLDDLRVRHHVLSVRFPGPPRDRFPTLPGVLSAESLGGTWTVICEAETADALRGSDGEVTTSRNASLEEIFLARVGRERVELKGTA